LKINLYKINSDKSYGGIEESHSDIDIDIKDYTAPLGYTFIPPSKETDVWNGSDWVAPYIPTLDELKSVKRAEIAASRFNAEVAGIMGIRTDRESQALLTGACLQAIIDPTYTLNWKTDDGSFVELTAEDVKAIGATVRVHVQTQFDREKELNEQIDTATTAEELSLISW
jgi:hypothetical protein